MTVDEALEILSILLAMQQDRDKVRSVLQAVYEHGKAEGTQGVMIYCPSLPQTYPTIPTLWAIPIRWDYPPTTT